MTDQWHHGWTVWIAGGWSSTERLNMLSKLTASFVYDDSGFESTTGSSLLFSDLPGISAMMK